MRRLQTVIDANVFLSALRSDKGASFLLLMLVGQSSLFDFNLSVPLALEYDDVSDPNMKVVRQSVDTALRSKTAASAP